MELNNNLFLKSISIDKNLIDSFDVYPFNIDVVKNFSELNFDSPVTFFVGENGVGKSTFIEALAVALGLPAEGGLKILDMKRLILHLYYQSIYVLVFIINLK